MPAATTEFSRKQIVVARRDLPGVPAGTTGIVLTSVGLSWERYRVRFDNGVEIGSIDVGKLASLDDSSVTLRETEEDPSTDPQAAGAFTCAVLGILVAIGTWFWPFEVRWVAVVSLTVASLAAVILAHRSLPTVSRGIRRGMPLVVGALLLGYLGLLFALLGALWLLAD
ncbi:MAG: hypothetical protein ACERLM_01395 [Acidimicrobiales bacterium]